MFKIHSDYKPTGDQPKEIEYLAKEIRNRKGIEEYIKEVVPKSK